MANQADVGAIVGFSGPGGSTLGLHWAGVTRTIGIEYDKNAVATARAAGFTVIHDDIRKVDPFEVRRQLGTKYLLLQMSPPCPSFSRAGNQRGAEDLALLTLALEELSTWDEEKRHPWSLIYRDMFMEDCVDERSALTFEPAVWIAALMPDLVMMEQVPPVLPVWGMYASLLEAWGYSVWHGNVHSEQFGVAQTRKRAMLNASRHGTVIAPIPTHSKFHTRDPKRLDPGVKKWVSMAEALDFGMTDRPSLTVTGGGTLTGGAEPFGNQSRQRMKAEIESGRWVDRS